MSTFFKVLLLFLLSFSIAAQRNLYISPSGSDSNAGTSSTAPYKTFSKVASIVQAGDVVNIMDGTYTNASYNPSTTNANRSIWNGENTIYFNNINGTASAYITIQPMAGHHPIIKGDGDVIFQLRNSSYVKIIGLEIEGEVDRLPLNEALTYQFKFKKNSLTDPVVYDRAPVGTTTDQIGLEDISNITTFRPSIYSTIGLLVQNGNHIDVQNCTIHHCPGTGLRVFGSDYVNIIGNDIHNNSRRGAVGNHGLVLHSAKSIDNNDGYKIFISRNKVHDNYNEVFSWSEIKNFITAHIDEGKGISLQKNDAADWIHGRVLVDNNITYGNGYSGVHVNVGVRIDIINNLSYNNNRSFDGTGAGNTGISLSDAIDVKVYNNISVTPTSPAGGYTYSADLNSTNYVVSNNLSFGNIDVQIDARDQNTISADPKWTNPSSFDFTLQSNSPAIGAALAIVVPTLDFTGATRDANPDLGPIEYTGTVSTVTAVGGSIAGATTITSPSNSTTLTLSGHTGTIQWQISSDGTTYTNISGATATTYTASNITATKYYRALITGTSTTAYSTVATLTYSYVAPTIFQVGTGTGSNLSNSSGTNVGYPTPYGLWKQGNRLQMIYRASDLTAIGATAGNITSIAFNVVALNAVASLNNYSLKIKQSTTSSITAWETSGFTTVFSSSSYMPTIGWNTHTFSSPFAWDGTSNLIIEICSNNTTSTLTDGNASVEWTQGLPAGTSLTNYSSSSTTICTDNATVGATAQSETSRPNAKFTFAPSCSSQTTPTFNAVAAICSGATLATLPTTSTNGITGSWSPALNNTATTTYTFTPNAGQCATTQTMTITVNPKATITGTSTIYATQTSTLTPSITGGTWTSSNTSVATVSTNGVVTGVSAGNATITYTTPTGCETTQLFTINASVTATGGTISGTSTICSGSTATLTLVNSAGTIQWQSSTDNTTFTNIAGATNATYTTGTLTQTTYYKAVLTGTSTSATSNVFTVTVSQPTIPTFNPVAAICSGGTLSALPTTSNNGITGTWSPALNNTTTTNYTFTPNTGVCASTQSLTIVVNPVASITGSSIINVNSTSQLSASITGGTWSSSNTSVATVSSSGLVTGIANGTSAIAYTDNNGCVNTVGITVNQSGAINAPTIVDATSGGGSIIVSFTAPSTLQTITIYEYSTDGGSTWASRTDGQITSSPIIISKLSSNTNTNLSRSTDYAIQIRAKASNIVGSAAQIQIATKANSYVFFNANGGTGSMTSLEFVPSNGITLPLNSFTRTGYDFIGWSFNASAEAIDQYPNDGLFKGRSNAGTDASDVTIYAIWVRKNPVSSIINVNNKQSVVDAFNAEFFRIQPAVNFSGASGCYEGTISLDYRLSILQRINWYRRMLGLADAEHAESHEGTNDKFYTISAQNWAWVSSQNNIWGHYYTQAQLGACWDDYVAKGKGGETSNICGGCTGVWSTDAFIADGGIPTVGHRVWLIEPRQSGFAFGEVGGNHATLIFTNSTKNATQPIPKILAYPGPGYFPASYAIGKRWSFKFPVFKDNGAAFANATVSVTGPEGIVAITGQLKADGMFLFDPAVIAPTSASVDRKYTVTISGIKNQNIPSISYDVILYAEDKAYISFNANGGTGTMPDQYIGTDEEAINENIFTKSGNVFVGWATSPTGPVIFAKGATITESNVNFTGSPKRMVLYAVWKCSNAGIVTIDNQRVCAGGTTNLKAVDYYGTLQWQSSTDNVNFTDIAGATNETYTTGAITGTQYFRVKATGSCAADYSSSNVVQQTPILTSTILGASSITQNGTASMTIGGTEIALDGVNDYIGTNVSLSNYSRFTLEGRVYVNSLTRSGLFGQNDVIEFGLNSASQIGVWTPGGGSLSWNFTNTSFAANKWYHLALVGNGSNLKLYVDGIEVATGGGTTSSYGTSDYKFNIGGGGIMNTTGDHFNGKMDEVRVWNVERTAAQILANKDIELTGPQTGLVAYYKLNQGVANATNAGVISVTDNSGNNNTATLYNSNLSGTTSNWLSDVSSELNPWSSSNNGVFTVSNAGIVTAIGGGTANLTYSIGGGCSVTKTISVVGSDIIAVGGTISGTSTVCLGSSANLNLSNSNGGIQWQSSTDNINFTNISGATSSNFTTSTLTQKTYFKAVLSGTSTTATSNVFTVDIIAYSSPTFNPVPAICSGATLTALPTTSTNGFTGSWAPALNNTATTTYTFTPNAGVCANTHSITIVVNQIPTIIGTTAINVGATSQLSSNIGGGTWVSSNTSVASVSSSGLVTNLALGTSNIIYTSPGGCVAQTSVNISTASSITGANSMYLGETITLSTKESPFVATQLSPTGTELNFDGSNDYVKTNLSLNNLSKFTIEGKFNLSKTSGVVNGLFGQYPLIKLYYSGVTLTASTNAGSINYNFSSSSVFSLNSWHHVALVGNGTDIKLYFDGTLLETAAGSTSNYGTSTDNFNIGGFQRSASTAPTWYYFNGNIDEVRVWNVERTADQIAANKDLELSLPQTGLMAYYKFNQGINAGSNTNVTTLNDFTSNANNGTLNGFALNGASSNWVSNQQVAISPWSSSDINKATISSNGVITALSPGLVTISFKKADGVSITKEVQILDPNAIITAAGGTITGTSSVCSGSTSTLTLSNSAGTIQWQSSTDNVNFTNIVGATNTTYTTGTVTQTTYYKAVLTGTSTTATSNVFTVTVTQPTTPTFNAVASICSGGTLSALPTSSNNSITGTWSPAVNNTATTTYTFTPTSGQCANTQTMTIVVNPLPIITGNTTINATSQLSASITGGTWSSSNTGVATVSSSGLVTGITIGTSTITYTGNNGCINSVGITVNQSGVINAPTNLTATSGGGSIVVSFTSPSSTQTITTYEYSTDGGSTWTSRTDGQTTSSPIIISKLSSNTNTNLSRNTNYTIQIRAKSSSITGSAAQIQIATKANSYVFFNANSGSGSMNSVEFVPSTGIILPLNTFTRTGYDFIGWSFSSNAEKVDQYPNYGTFKGKLSDGSDNSDVQLYAIWARITPVSTLINASNKQSVIDAYNAEFFRVEPAVEFSRYSGAPGCDEGTISLDYRLSILQRLNWYRRFLGLADVEHAESHEGTNDKFYTIAGQNWAWVSDKYTLLGHYYTQADVRECWDDYVAKGEGGKIANLSGGSVGIKAADGLMRDDLFPSPLHRQWYLEPRIGGFAFGEVAQRHASVINFSSTKNSNQVLPKFLAYPRPGYFPASLTHRPNYLNVKIDWSFTLPILGDYPDAFSNATVTVVGPEGPVTLTDVMKVNGLIQFTPNIIIPTSSSDDRKYTVTISGINHQNLSTINYDVILFAEDKGTVQFDSNGGVGSMSNQYFNEDNEAINTNSFTKLGYLFAGWSTSVGGSVVFQNGDLINSNNTNFSEIAPYRTQKILKLYAVWQVDPNYTSAGGTITGPNDVNIGSTITLQTTENPTTAQVLSPTGTELSFDGSNDFVSTNLSLNNVSKFTIEGMFLPSSLSLAKTDLVGQYGSIRLYFNSPTYLYGITAAGSVIWFFTSEFQLNVWHHIAFVGDGTTLKLYVDGVVKASSNVTTSNYGTSTNLVKIGSGVSTAADGNYFAGKMDEIRIWNTDRSSTDINTYKNTELSGTQTGLLAYYKFNQGLNAGNNTNETSLKDEVANGHNGTLHNFALSGSTSNWVSNNTVTANAWSSANTAIATVSNTGVVTGVSAGTVLISFTKSDGSKITKTINVGLADITAAGGTISGTSSICSGSTAALTLANSAGTIQWQSSTDNVTFTNISGATNATYTSGALTQTTYYKAVLTGTSTTATSNVFTVTVTQPTTPTFNAVASICSGGTLSALPTTSTNSITGTWSPAVNNTATTTYTFTPTSGQCANTQTMTIVVNPVASISGGTSVYSGQTLQLNSSISGGTWSSSNSSIATIDANGLVSGLTNGSTTISYTTSIGCIASINFSVLAPVTAVGGSIAGAATITSPTNSTTLTLSGHTGTVQWQSSSDGTTFTNISGATGTTYTASNITATKYYRALITGTTTTAYSSVAILTYNYVAPTEIQIGTGTGSSPVKEFPTPYSTLKMGHHIQLLYLASELSAQNVSAGNITSIAFNVKALNSLTTSSNYSIKIKQVSNSINSLSAMQTTGFTTVYNAATFLPTLGWNVHSFSSPYNWDGTSNIVIDLCWDGTSTSNGTASVEWTTGFANAMSLTNYDGKNTGICSDYTVQGTTASVPVTNTTRPNAKFTFAPTCSSQTTPTFNAVAAICSGATLATLPTTSTNGITGSWSPALNNTATTTYTFTPNAGQCATTQTMTITVNPKATITGTSTIYATQTSTLTPSITGGTWTTSNASIATVNTSGVVTGVSAGNATITYTTPSGCETTQLFTINASVTAAGGTISGTSTICSGSTTTLTLANSAGTIQWQSSTDNTTFTNIAGATNATYTTGTLTQTTYYKAVLTGTSTSATSNVFTVTVTQPTIPTFNEVAAICSGGTLSALPTTSNNGITGSWSPALNNTATTTYTFTPNAGQCATNQTLTITINPNSTITGTAVISTGVSSQLSSSISGGTWSSSNTNVATVSTNGLVSGISDGSATISYTTSNGCLTTQQVTVSSGPMIVGVSSLIIGETASFSSTASPTSGTELSKSGTELDFDGTNDYVTTTANLANLSQFTLEGNFNATTLKLGTNAMLLGQYGSIRLNIVPSYPLFSFDAITPNGGYVSWNMSSAADFSLNTWHHVAIVGDGSTLKLYIDGLLKASANITVSNYGTVDKYLNIGGGQVSSTGTFGYFNGKIDEVRLWSVAKSATEINSNRNIELTLPQTGLKAYYKFNQGVNAGANSSATTLNDASSNALNGTLSGFALTGNTSNWVSNVQVPLNPWSSSNTSIATISSTGVVTAINAGSTTISFLKSDGSTLTKALTVNTPPVIAVGGNVSGNGQLCTGSSTTLNLTGSTGTIQWQSSTDNVNFTNIAGAISSTYTTANLNQTTYFKAILTGTSTTASSNVFTVTVVTQQTAPIFSAVSAICSGATLTALPTTSNNGITGVWSPALNNTATTTYTFTPNAGQCATSQTLTITVNPKAVITGENQIKPGLTSPLNTTITGGTWASSNSKVATVNTNGLISGVTEGTSTISYTLSNGCVTNYSVVISNNITALGGTISGSSQICAGNTTSLVLSNSAGTIQWQSSTDNINFNTIAGATSATYTTSALTQTTYFKALLTGTSTTATSNVFSITINAPTLTGTIPSIVGTSAQLTGSGIPDTTNAWTTSNSSVATVTSTGLVKLVGNGTADIIYTNSVGCSVKQTINTDVTQFYVPVSGNVSITTCSGKLYDDGGPNGVNNAHADGYLIINPGVAGKKIRLTGSYAISDGWNLLTIYDGAGLDGEILFNGSGGSTSFNITSYTGAITVKVKGNADPSVWWSDAGINFDISCVDYIRPGGIASGPSEVCQGAALNLTLSNYTGSISRWEYSNNINFTTSTPIYNNGNSITASGIAGTNYYHAVLTSAGTTYYSNAVKVVGNTLPTISGNGSIDINENAQLVVSGLNANTNNWVSDNNTIASINSNGLLTGISNGNTFVRYTDSKGCISTYPILVYPSGSFSAPTNLVATSGAGKISIAFTPPVSSEPITSYEYSTDGGVSWLTRMDGQTNSSPLIVSRLSSNVATKLAVNTSYTILLRAKTASSTSKVASIVGSTTSATSTANPVVIFNANGGIGTMISLEFVPSTGLTLPRNNFTKEGFDFIGWSLSNNAETIGQYFNYGLFKGKNSDGSDASDVNLYAVWAQKAPVSNSINVTNRKSVVDAFNAEYFRKEPAINFSGGSGCYEGTISLDYRLSILQRINWFRRMLGLADAEHAESRLGTNDKYYTISAQNWAWVSTQNNIWGHYYSQSQLGACWDDYVAKGKGGEMSNISGGSLGVNSTNAFMYDGGVPTVGHRTWLIGPRAGGFAFGEVGRNHATIVLTGSNKNATQPLPKILAYPGPGYFPSFYAVGLRWHFSMPVLNESDAAFADATVSVVGPEGPVQINGQLKSSGLILFDPAVTAPTSSSADRKYTVTISGIKNSEMSSISYDVILFKEDKAYITFNANGGTGAMPDQYIGSEDEAINSNTFAKTNNAFAGWALTPTGPVVFENGATINEANSNFTGGPKNMQLYAVWKCSNAGKVSIDNQRVCAGGTTNLKAVDYYGTLQWQSSTDNVNFTDIAGATNETYTTGAITGTQYYRVKATGSCAADYSAGYSVQQAPILTTSILGATSIAQGGTSTMTVAGTEIALDGFNDYIGTNVSLSNYGKFTLEGRVYVNSLTRSGFFGQNDVIEFGLNSASQIGVWTPGGGSLSWDFTNSTFVPNRWYHVALVGNGSNMKLFVDGVQVATGGGTTSNYGSSTYKFNIGGGGIMAASGDHFAGKMDEIRVWNVERTAAQILANKDVELSGTQTGLVAYYKMNQGKANSVNTGVTSVTDYSGNSNTATLNNSALNAKTSNWISDVPTISNPWRSSNNNVFTVSNTGVLTAVGGGTATLTYAAGGYEITKEITVIGTNVTAVGGTISGTNQLCSGSSTALTLTGSAGVIQWQSSTDNVTFTNITGATSASYATGNLTQTTYYRAVLTGTSTTASSNVFTVTVNQPTSPTFTQVAAICSGETLSALPTTSSNSITGSWLPALNTAATTTYTFTPTSGQCANTQTMTITVNPKATLTGTTSIYAGLTSQLGASITGGSWGSSNTGIATVNTSGLVTGIAAGSSTITYTTSAGCLTNQSVTISAPVVAVGGTINGATTITSPSNSTTLTLSGHTGTIQWQSSSDGTTYTNISGATGTTYTASNITATKYYRALITGTTTTAYSSVAILTYNYVAPTIFQVGSGTDFSSDKSFPTTYGSLKTAYHTQLLYSASELITSGAVLGNLNAVSFNVKALNGVTALGNYTIKIKNTSQNSLSNWETTGLTTVYTSSSYMPTTGWNTHTFSSPFVWDGISNILLDICWSASGKESNVSVEWTQNFSNVMSLSNYHGTLTNLCDEFKSQASTGTVIIANTSRPNAKFTVSKSNTAPKANDGASTINSNYSQGTIIANLDVGDDDGDPLTFSFISGNESGIFSINANGQLILAKKPNVLEDNLILVIRVSDGKEQKTLTFKLNLCESNFEAKAVHLNITKTYKSKDNLKGSAKISGSSNVTMEAPKTIELLPGFVADKGTIFKASIGAGCQ